MTSPSDDAIATATRVMLALTGHRWTWPPRMVLEEYIVPNTVDSVHLTGRPVRSIIAVTDAASATSYEYELADGFRLRFPALTGAAWPREGGYPPFNWNGFYPPPRRSTKLWVRYVYGAPPPNDVLRAINEFATELDAAAAGGDCKLPSRVTSITREGISWTVLDPQQFLEGGKLGMYFPDLVISTYGARTRARSRVWSPEYKPPRRLSSIQLPVPS